MPNKNRRKPRRRSDLRYSEESDCDSDEDRYSQTRVPDGGGSQSDSETSQAIPKGDTANFDFTAKIAELAPDSDWETIERVDRFVSTIAGHFTRVTATLKFVLDLLPQKYKKEILPKVEEFLEESPDLFTLVTEGKDIEEALAKVMPRQGVVTTENEGIQTRATPARMSVKRSASRAGRDWVRGKRISKGEETGEEQLPASSVTGRERPTSSLQSKPSRRPSMRGGQPSVPRVRPVSRSAVGPAKQLDAPVHTNLAALPAAPSAESLSGTVPVPTANHQASVPSIQSGGGLFNRPPARPTAPPVPSSTRGNLFRHLLLLGWQPPPPTDYGHLPTVAPASSGIPSTAPQVLEQPPVAQNVAHMSDNIYAEPGQPLPGSDMPETDWAAYLMQELDETKPWGEAWDGTLDRV